VPWTGGDAAIEGRIAAGRRRRTRFGPSSDRVYLRARAVHGARACSRLRHLPFLPLVWPLLIRAFIWTDRSRTLSDTWTSSRSRGHEQ